MLIIKLTLILLFIFLLLFVYIYLKNHLNMIGNAGIVLKIVIMLIILNIIIMTSIILFAAYQSEWRMIGRPGDKGDDGTQGPRGDAICGDDPTQDYCRGDVELYQE